MSVSRILRIGYVMDNGGAETFIMKLFRSLYQEGVIFDFLVMGEKKGYYDEEIMSMGGKIYNMPPIKKHPFECLKFVYNCIKDHGYDRVLLVTEVSYHFIYLLIAKLAGAKILAARSACASNSRGKIKKKIHHLLVNCMRLVANKKIAPSIDAGQFLFGKGFPKYDGSYILHNGLPLSKFRFDSHLREEARKELGLKNAVIGHVGRLDKQKNHSFIIDIFYEYLKNRDCTLLLVGDGSLRQDLESKVNQLGIQDKVIFTGVRSDVEKLLMAMDAMIFPSFFEGMPNVIIEAQASGLPCVISNTITEECKVTPLVSFLPLNDGISQWCKALDMALENNIERSEYYNTLVEKKYDIKDVRDNFISIMNIEK